MTRKVVSAVLASAFALLLAAATPALAAGGTDRDVLVLGGGGPRNASSEVLAVTFSKPVSAVSMAQIGSALSRRLGGSLSPAAHGPQGAFLYCDHAYNFGDADGNFTFQHKCGGATGPWGYRLSAGLCSIVVSAVHEDGMAWHRNGRRQGTQAQHTEFCRYQFHGTFNPDHDYDFINYSDTFTFRIDVGGHVGSADLTVSGSFTSAGCRNRIACGP
jgi:hypothetical protein